jgi:predicted DNA-binding transcriptional regulator AlpA
MPVSVQGVRYLTASDVLERIPVTRQTLWRWRQEGKIPAGSRYRGRQVLFSPEEVAAIEAYANRIEPIEPSGARQLGLFRRAASTGNGGRP